MPRQNINGRVQRRETRLPSDLWESPVITHKLDHFLLEIFAKVFHSLRALGHAGGRDHVGADLCGVRFVVVGESPVGGEFVLFGLFGDGDFGGSDCGEEEGGCRGGRGGLEKLTTSRLVVLNRVGMEN